MKLQIKSKNGIAINSTTPDWRNYAPPQNPDKHWQDGHSAKELAKSVFDNKTFIPKIESILKRFSIPVPDEMHGVPEMATKLIWGTRGNRKHDLFLIDNRASMVIGIEAKADESFDKPIKNKRANAKKNADGGANMSTRLDGMLNYLYDGNPPQNREDLMYQLLSATAGVIIEANKRGIKKACIVFLVFYSNQLSQSKIAKNEADWCTFCKTINLDKDGGIVEIQGVECLIIKEQIDI